VLRKDRDFSKAGFSLPLRQGGNELSGALPVMVRGMRGISSKGSRRQGFTLLELILSLAIFLLLTLSAFTLTGAVIELMVDVVESQAQTSQQVSYVNACRIAFESLSIQ